jgi:hypothetical protein
VKIGRLDPVGIAMPSIADPIAFCHEVTGAAVILAPRNKQLENPSNNNDNIPL